MKLCMFLSAEERGIETRFQARLKLGKMLPILKRSPHTAKACVPGKGAIKIMFENNILRDFKTSHMRMGDFESGSVIPDLAFSCDLYIGPVSRCHRGRSG